MAGRVIRIISNTGRASMKVNRQMQIHNTERRCGVLGPLVVNTGQHTVRSANDNCGAGPEH
jgi:hypothetical protein